MSSTTFKDGVLVRAHFLNWCILLTQRQQRQFDQIGNIKDRIKGDIEAVLAGSPRDLDYSPLMQTSPKSPERVTNRGDGAQDPKRRRTWRFKGFRRRM